MPAIEGLIELPPEANPLTPQNLYQTLANASSHHQVRIQVASQQLSSWEKKPGYYSSLQSILIDKSIAHVRYLAVIQLKHGIDKYWRKTAQNAISKEEKSLIRSRCVEYGINEADHRLALQNAILTAKIVRYDFPHDWPDAITSVSEALRRAASQDAGSVHLPRTLLITLYILKELSTARLTRTRENLYKAAPEIFRVLASVYLHKVNSWVSFMTQGGIDEARAINDIELSLLALRTLRRALIFGFEHPSRHEEVQEFWNVLRLHFGELLGLVRGHGQSIPARLRWFVERHLIQISKIHLDMVRVHPPSFPQLPEAIEIAKAYWGLLSDFGQTYGAKNPFVSDAVKVDDDDEPSYMEILCLKALLLLRACVKMVFNPARVLKYQTQQDYDARKASTQALKTKLLEPSLVQEMASMLVNLFFVYTPKDLRLWDVDPAEWEQREAGSGDSWEFSIRLCAERLFLDLVTNNKDLLVPSLLERFRHVSSLDKTQVLQKDSTYAAIGLAAPVLDEKIDFDSFMRTTLTSDIQNKQRGSEVLRRRIAIMLGQWIVVKDIDRTLVYEIFQYLLDKSDELNDYVVRVTAGRQMDHVINTWDLQVANFTPFAATILDRLLGLVEEAVLDEGKVALLNAINSIVVRLELNVNAYADHVVALLPPLWEQAGEEYLLKQTMLGILSALITSMKAESARFHNLIIPLVESSIRPGSDSEDFLLEDGLELWSSLITQTEAPASSQLLDLVQYLIPLYESGSETLVKALEITEQYVLLATEAMLKVAPRFMTTLAILLAGNVRGQVRGKIVRIAELLLQQAHGIGGAEGVQVVVGILIESKFLPQIISGLKSAHDAHQTTGPNRTHTDIEGIIESDYFGLVARILYSSPNTFVDAVAASAGPFEKAIDWLLTEWFSDFQDMGNSARKKLMCLALSKLFELGPDKKLQDRLQDYVDMWTDVVMECIDYEQDDDGEPIGEGRDCLVYDDISRLKWGDAPDAPEDERRRKLLFYDPVHRVNVKEYVRFCVQRLVEACGGLGVFQNEWLVNVDADVVKGFASLKVV